MICILKWYGKNLFRKWYESHWVGRCAFLSWKAWTLMKTVSPSLYLFLTILRRAGLGFHLPRVSKPIRCNRRRAGGDWDQHKFVAWMKWATRSRIGSVQIIVGTWLKDLKLDPANTTIYWRKKQHRSEARWREAADWHNHQSVAWMWSEGGGGQDTIGANMGGSWNRFTKDWKYFQGEFCRLLVESGWK